MLVHQCLGSDSELRKSLGLSEGVHHETDSGVMFCSSSSKRIAVHIDMYAEHREHLSSLGTVLGHCVGDEPWKLCSTQSQTLTCACQNTGVQSALFGGWLVRFPRQLQTDY